MTWRDSAAAAAEVLERTVSAASGHLAAGTDAAGRVPVERIDAVQEHAYELAFLAAEAGALGAMVEYAAGGEEEELLAKVAVADLLRSARSRFDGRHHQFGFPAPPLRHSDVDASVAAGSDPEVLDTLAALLPAIGSGPVHLSADLALAASTFRRFAEEKIAPRAGEIHRRDLDLPEEIISELAGLGVFGLSIPAEYGGSFDVAHPDYLAMLVVTEELTRGSLAAGGSLITRPEILARALLQGGTDEQQQRWLPGIASGDLMVAVAVTEPDYGSDVAGLRTLAVRHQDRYLLRGTKTWCTFAGRAELLMVLARTDPDLARGHRGLSLFVVEKPRRAGHSFRLEQPEGGEMSGRAIPTLGYRGMHSFEVVFADWAVPGDAMVGGTAGEGRGFYLQMEGFTTGRLQTAARAVGLMEAAFTAALRYAAEREVFGRPIAAYRLSKARLARMAARIQTCRQFAHRIAGRFVHGEGRTEVAMVKALACRAAEEVTRDAMQLHGGYGYAEEYPVSRYFVDARVLSIFEGAEETLALRVIARDLLGAAALAALPEPTGGRRKG